MNNDKQHIAELLDRFMAGESSLDDEQQIARYMASHEVDDDWLPYKEMFAYFDSGMVDEEPATSVDEDAKKHRIAPLWWRWAAAAALLLAVAGATLWLWRSGREVVNHHDAPPIIAQADSSTWQPSETHRDDVTNPSPQQPELVMPTPTRQRYRKVNAIGTKQLAQRHKHKHKPVNATAARPIAASDSVTRAKMQGELELTQMSVDADYMLAQEKLLAARLECELAILQAHSTMPSFDDDDDEQHIEY